MTHAPAGGCAALPLKHGSLLKVSLASARQPAALLAWLTIWAAGSAAAQNTPPDWRVDWAVADSFTLRRDATGFRFPTAIGFVPHPGPRPGDPFYFVTELQGTIKVVTNDRSVHEFASVSAPTDDTLPAQTAEVGLAGICLEPAHGYVFATYAYRDSTGVLRNALVRYQTTPGRFDVRPRKTVSFLEPFARDTSAPSHQIGPCQATTREIFISVGDGEQATSQDLTSTLGKILRLRHDGRPAATNPFYGKGGVAAYVWARGVRNPFGLKLVGDRLMAADNGDAMDRFVEIERGRNYLWDGTDRGIGAAAAQSFAPAISPVQLDYCTRSGLPLRWRDRFFVAVSGRPADTGPNLIRRMRGVIALDYGLRERRMRSVPENLIRYRGTHHQSVVGLGCGPDGIYFVPIFPDTTGETAVLVAQYAPDSAYPYPLFGDDEPLAFMERTRCFGCHTLNGKGGTVGPVLDYDSLVPRLRARLESEEYRTRVHAVDSLTAPVFAKYRAARTAVLAAPGDRRLFTWLRYHLREPKFDNPNAQMPNLGLSDADAVSVAQFLLTPPPPHAVPPPPPRKVKPQPQGPVARLLYRLPLPRRVQLAIAFAGGLLIGGGLALAADRRRRRPPPNTGTP